MSRTHLHIVFEQLLFLGGELDTVGGWGIAEGDSARGGCCCEMIGSVDCVNDPLALVIGVIALFFLCLLPLGLRTDDLGHLLESITT
jgi:hypothetical protein